MLFVAIVIIAAAVYLMARRVEVRLVLLGAGLLLATFAGKPLVLFDTFTAAMVATMVAPICAAMGFAAVLAATGCDRHLVHLLLAPMRRARWLLVPGGMFAAYLVNIAIPSQTSTAAALGPVLVPLLRAGGIGPEVAGAALILGASFGGDLLHPAAQDVVAVSGVTGLSATALRARVVPASAAGALVAFLVFSLLNRRPRSAAGEESVPGVAAETGEGQPQPSPLRLNPLKALLPLVPIALLLLAATGWGPLQWLLRVPEGADGERLRGALPVVRAMLLGTFLAALVGWREVQQVMRSLFEGMGAAYGSIISLTISAQCFGAGVAAIGVSSALIGLLGGSGFLARLLAVVFPWMLAALSGSGSGPILTFAQTFLTHLDARYDPVTLAAIACLAGAFGRTMSPVAAVVVYSSGLVGVSPLVLVRRLLPALLAGAATALTVATLRG